MDKHKPGYWKEYRLKNPEKKKLWAKRYYEKHKEELKEYDKKYREINKDRLNKNRMIIQHETGLWFKQLKSTYCCAACGENHVACLSFHHNNPREKEADLAHAYQHWCKERILAEIEKCTVLCENCHRKLHYTANFYNPYYQEAI